MLWSTHRRIARRIADELELNSRETLCLEKASVRPDYLKNYPHHYGKEREIRKHILRARRLFLDGKKLDSLFCFGIALHYIQDGWVTVSGSNLNHGWWEDEIDSAPFVNDIMEMIKEFPLTQIFHHDLVPAADAQNDEKRYFQICNQLLELYQICRNSFEGYNGQFAENATLNITMLERPKLGTPIFDLNFAYKVSLMVALSVYGPETSINFQERLEQIRESFEVKLNDAEAALAKKLIDLNNKRTELQQKNGLINRVKKLICNFKIWVNRRRYENGSHLLEVQRTYHSEVERESESFKTWYNIITPELDIKQVKRLLIQ